MPSVKFSELATTTVIAGTELVPILQQGVNRTTTLDSVTSPLQQSIDSQVTALSSAIDVISPPVTWYSVPNGNNNLTNFTSVNLSNDTNNLSTTEVTCFDAANDIRVAKLLLHVFGLSAYMTSEVLISYYEINSTPGIKHVRYSTMGTSGLINFDTRLDGSTAILQLTPSITGLHVDLQQTFVLSTTASAP
tara:strand:+ start:1037 stop:1609 length:573 start_codon:yes stop_codon:yes gene_type:complete